MARHVETKRMCALTRETKPVTELIRFVLGADGQLVPDTSARAEGRGVWISLDREAVAEAVRKKAFARSLKTDVRLPNNLPDLTQQRLEQRFLNALNIARKAGQFTFGATKVKKLIETGNLVALITATDAAVDSRNKMTGALKALHYTAQDEGITAFNVPHFELLSSAQMNLALGLENMIHAALTTGAAAQSAVEKAYRLALYTAKPTEMHIDRPVVDDGLLPEAHDERREIHG